MHNPIVVNKFKLLTHLFSHYVQRLLLLTATLRCNKFNENVLKNIKNFTQKKKKQQKNNLLNESFTKEHKNHSEICL